MTQTTDVGMQPPGARLRNLIADPDILVLPGVFDGFSARVVEAAGYGAALVSGAGLSECHLGVPDVGIMGLKENLDATAAIANCSSLLLVADADTGYGDAGNVYHAVRAFEQAGVAGIMIEDQVWPKRCGHLAGKEVTSAEEMVAKVEAATEARRDPSFVIKARTDAAGPLGIDEAIRRACLYAAAGADLLFADALATEADMARFAAETPAPVAVNMGFGLRSRPTTPLVPVPRLAELGVAVVEYPRLLTSAAVRGMQVALATLGETVSAWDVVERPELQVSFDELNRIMGLAEIEDIRRRHAARPAG